MDNELTQPLGELSPLYSLGAEFTKRRGGTGHVVTDEDTNALRLATQIMRGQDQDLAQNRITAYHGSPYDFEQFDTSKIGTGEGAQAYGHGLYFAEHEPVAKEYRDRLTDRTSSFRVGNIDMPKWILRGIENAPDRNAAIEKHRQDFLKRLDEDTKAQETSVQPWMSAARISSHKDILAGLDQLQNGSDLPHTKGRMYEVAIDAHPDHMLDWDKPLSEQSPHIVKSIFDARKDNPTLFKIFKPHIEKDSTGMGFYQSLATQHPNGYQGASEFLQRAGIPGIHYLDANSRKNGDGTRNYVVFDPKNIEIMRRYAKGGDVRHGYSTDGMVKPDNNTIEMPHSLKELQDWYKTHPATKPMVRASDDPTSILYNERKLDMPNSLEELQNWARMHHASGGSIDHIAKAMHLARKHFDDGGDARAGDSVGGLRGDTGGYSGDQGGGDNFRADSLAQSQQASDDAQRAADIRANNQDVGRFSFGQNVDTSGANFTGHEAPTGLVSYTTQRETTPYEGTPMTAAQNPSDAFGMAYPSLVGVQNTPAGAAALLANLGYESTQGGKAFQPNAISGSGYGLAQWTDPSRQAAFFNAMQPGTTANNPIAKMAILGTTTPGQQLGYALNEIQQKYPSVAREMATSTNRAATTENIMDKYESPATRESLDARIALANQIARGTGTGSFAREALNQSPSGNSFAAISPSVTSAVRSALGAGRGDVGTLDSSLAKAMASNDTINSGANAVVGTVDGGNANTPAANVPAANAPTPQPNILDKIFGSTQDQIDKLAAAGQYAGMDKQQYADQFAGGDINAVKERIINQDGQPKVDYYTKDLSQALFGDPLKALSSGLGNLFSQKQNYDPLTGQYRPDISASVGQEPSPFRGHGGGQQPIPYIPPVETAATAAPVAPVAPYVPQTPYIPPANTPYASLGANFVDPRMYQNPLFSQVLATGGKVHGNNAMGNALRMAMANKP